jgi:hypothetical protein
MRHARDVVGPEGVRRRLLGVTAMDAEIEGEKGCTAARAWRTLAERYRFH